MKKSLLLIASVVMSTAAAFAQWVKPVPEFSAMVDDGETIQYLYNVEYGGFLLGANDWNTRASLSQTHGLKMKFKKNYTEFEDDEQTIPVEESLRWALLDSCETGNKAGKWSEYDCQGYDNIWCDGDGRGGAGLWIITALGDNKYQLTNENVTDADGNALLFGWSPYAGDATNNRCWMLNYTLENDDEVPLFDPQKACTSWAFISEGAYMIWEAEMARYTAAEKLIAYVKQAEEECPGIDLSPCHIIYNNTQSTLEDLERSYGYAEEIVGDWKSSHATVDDPQDVTVYIENPTFDVIGDFHGWEGDGWGAGGTTSTCAERYSMNFNTYQDVYHGMNIPNGIYKLSAYAFYRAGGVSNDWDTKDDPSVRHAKLYARSGEDSLYVAMPSLSSWAINTTTLGGVAIGDGLHAPNTMADFVAWKDAGYGKKVSVYVPVENNQLRIGAAKNVLLGTDWTIVDDFSLMYYGDSDEAYYMWRDVVIGEAEVEFKKLFESVEYYYQPDVTEYLTFLAMAKQATSREDIKEYIKKIPEMSAKAAASIAAYEKFVAKTDEWIENINNNPDVAGDEWEAYCDFVQSSGTSEGYPELTPEEVLEECSLNAEEIDKYIATVDSLFKDAIASSLQPGDDCTNMLANASFADGFNGWTRGSGMTGDTYKSTDGAKNVVECYGDNHGVLDIYQIVTNVPDGVYSLTCQAFVRPGGNGSYTGEEATNVFLYMNDYKTEVMNIVEDALPTDLAINKENCFIDDGEHAVGTWPLDYEVTGAGYVPNSLQGATYAFKAGRYTQEAYGFVEGGTMKIGLTSNGVKPHWCLWADFRLTYLGKDAISIMLDKKIEDLEKFLDEHSNDMTDVAVNDAETVKEEAEGALDEGDPETMKEYMEKINDAITAAEENVAALAAFNEEYQTYVDLAESEEFESAIQPAQDAYVALLEELPEEYADLTTEDLNEYTEKMETVAANLRIPEYAEATAANPVDFTQIIINPSFETGDLTGWTYYQGSDTGSKDNSNTTYHIENADGNYVFNTWSGSAPAEGFWVGQSFKGLLPVGKYQLTALLASDQNNVITLSVNDISEDFTMANAKEMGQDGSIEFALKEPARIEIKASSGSWFKADHFRLTYFGAANISIEDITALIDRYLDGEEGITIETITNLIDEYLNQ